MQRQSPLFHEGPRAFLAWLASQPPERRYNPVTGRTEAPFPCPIAAWLASQGYTGRVDTHGYEIRDSQGNEYHFSSPTLDDIPPELAWFRNVQLDFFAARWDESNYIPSNSTITTKEALAAVGDSYNG